MTLTKAQKDVLVGALTENNPWGRVERGDVRRAKVILALVDRGLITASYNLSLAWITKKGLALIN